MPSAVTPLLRARHVAKAYGATRALDGVDLDIGAGEIVALMGANGAGKSTLVNILAGAVRADAGELTVAGRPYAPASPREASRLGVVTVHQATDRVGAAGLRVADVLLLDAFAAGDGPLFLSRRSVRQRAAAVAAEAGFQFDLDADFGDLGAADRQLVAIARALSARAAQASLLILDEPTASLSQAEAERLFGVLRRLKQRGLAILYISHRIADLQAIADRAVVLRGGRVAASFVRPIAFEAAVGAMIGRPLASAHAAAREARGAPLFELIGASLLPGRPAFDLRLARGEVVAVTGPLGAGKTRLLNAIFGNAALAGGRMRLVGEPYAPRTPQQAIARGVGLVGEDRHRSSLLPPGWPGATVAGTISLPHLKRWFPQGWLRPAVERRAAARAITRLGIKAAGPDAPIDTLSGGNQQKVVLARWQSEPTDLLLLDEPFQGVDVGARADIIQAIRSDAHGATLIATSDPEEAFEVADRIYHLNHHELTPWRGAPAFA